MIELDNRAGNSNGRLNRQTRVTFSLSKKMKDNLTIMAKNEGISRGEKIVELLEISLNTNYQYSKKRHKELDTRFRNLESEFNLQKYINNQQKENLEELKELFEKSIAASNKQKN